MSRNRKQTADAIAQKTSAQELEDDAAAENPEETVQEVAVLAMPGAVLLCAAGAAHRSHLIGDCPDALSRSEAEDDVPECIAESLSSALGQQCEDAELCCATSHGAGAVSEHGGDEGVESNVREAQLGGSGEED